MPGPAAILREIHRLRRHAHDLQGEIDRGPRTLKAQQAKVARQQEILREAQEGLKRLKITTHEKEGALRAKVQQIGKHEKQLNEAASKKEFDALQLEIGEEKKACQKLEDEILDGLALIDERAAQIPEIEKALEQARLEATQFEKETQGRQARLSEQLAQVSQQLLQVETTLPADIRPQYERLTAARGEDALAAVQGRTCAACYTEITAQNYNELLQSHFVVCKSCGRILYLPE
jgi:predicted  nucleic acid-binding Zn-ribbon protein